MRVSIVSGDSVLELFKDSHIVALRWDVIPFALTLDLDTVDSEALSAPRRRAWVVFRGVSLLTWPFNNVFIPTGWYCNFPMDVVRLVDGRYRYSIYFRFMQCKEPDGVDVLASGTALITANSIEAATSVDVAQRGSDDLTFEQRTGLLSDQEFIDAFRSNRPRVSATSPEPV